MDHLAVAGGRVDHGASPRHDAHMAAHHDDVSCLQIVKIGDLRVFAHAAPAGGGDVALPHPRLI